MIPEIELLNTNFEGKKWGKQTQLEFMKLLKDENFFNGSGENNPALSARDRITRAPKSLGFVILSPVIQLTPAGLALVNAKRKEEIFLRQLLKFQIPSPYLKRSSKSAEFWVKPYLEIFRLIRHFGSLGIDELMMFGLQLTSHKRFEEIVFKIDSFRYAKIQKKVSYKKFKDNYFRKELEGIYADDINSGNIKTREAKDASIDKFLRTKASNMRDYADACFRYLRATGLVNISRIGKTISIVPENIQDVDYLLKHTTREPVFIEDAKSYISHLGDARSPLLLTDDREQLEKKLKSEFPEIEVNTDNALEHLKETLFDELEIRKEKLLAEQVVAIKDYRLFGDINDVYAQIVGKRIYDAPLMLEWNTWRAMTMLDGGNIKANLKFDGFGNPLSTAQGNMADIVCDYGDFFLAVEVTMQSGQRQYDSEGEPVTRHVAKLKSAVGKPTYGLFVAPKINDACIAHFYVLHKTNVVHYGGTSTIVPLPLDIFLKMLEDSHKANCTPEPRHVQRFFERSNELAAITNNEQEWYNKMTEEALNWLN